jgi:Flp pilus assembly protein TadG
VRPHRTNSRRNLLRSNSRRISPRNREQGIVIALVAAFMLVVIGAMMALSIDVVTFYTARSEVQLAADSAALAGARVLANSGITTADPGGAVGNAHTLAQNVALQVAEQNQVGPYLLTAANVSVSPIGGTAADPTVTVTVQVTNLPTYFARILGTKFVTVGAKATAEAYNPSPAASVRTGPPVAPICVKPWLLPNIDPTTTLGTPIFDSASGEIQNANLVGQGWPNASGPNPNLNGLYSLCSPDCSGGISPPAPGGYYPGAVADFPAPAAQPACSSLFNSYQRAITGCVQTPITCGANSSISIDTLFYPNVRDADTLDAASCLIHYNGAPGESDKIDLATTFPPFQYEAGTANPVVGAVGKNVMVSDSLVTIPVINNPPGTPVNPVQVIGFLQVFINPQSATLPARSPPAGTNQLPVTIINMAGCGTNASGQPILGNGASPVAVRLISGP